MFEEDFFQCAIYVAVEIVNKSADAEQWFYLEDVYIDGEKSQSGSGVPVTVLPEKSAIGVFFISTAKKLEGIEEIEFVLVCKNNETMEEIFIRSRSPCAGDDGDPYSAHPCDDSLRRS